MDPQAGPVGTDPSEENAVSTPQISAHESSPDRVVLTEHGNTDGWISSDLTVDLTQQR